MKLVKKNTLSSTLIIFKEIWQQAKFVYILIWNIYFSFTFKYTTIIINRLLKMHQVGFSLTHLSQKRNIMQFKYFFNEFVCFLKSHEFFY